MMTHNLRKSRRRSRGRLHDCPSTVMTMTVPSPHVSAAQPFASATPSSEPAASPSGQAPRVVIVGAGFQAALSAATALRHEKVEVTLIDRRNYHLFQPLLYQVATAGLSLVDIAEPIRSILRRQRNYGLLGRVTAIDTQARDVLIGRGACPMTI